MNISQLNYSIELDWEYDDDDDDDDVYFTG